MPSSSADPEDPDFYGSSERPSRLDRGDELEAYRRKLRELLRSADELDGEVVENTRALIAQMQREILLQTHQIVSQAGKNGLPEWGDYYWLPSLQRAHNFVVEQIANQFSQNLSKFTVRAYNVGTTLADQGLKFATSHIPGLNILSVPTLDPETLKIASSFSADLITNLKQAQKTAVSKMVGLSVMLGEAPSKLIEKLQANLPGGPWSESRYRAEVIARTEVARVQELGRSQRMFQQQRANPGITIYKQYLVAPILRWPCRLCSRWDGHVWSSDGVPYIPADGPHAPELPLHPNCFIDGTPVLPVGAVEAAYRRRYDGPVVEIFLTSDTKPYLTVTPNHPILCGRGWIEAGELQESDSLVYCPGLDEVTAAPTTMGNVKHPYVRIEEVFQALSEASLIQRVPGLSMQFHGDGQEGEVDIVRADRELAFQAIIALEHLLEKPFLCQAHSREIMLASEGRILPAEFSSGSASPLLAFLKSHPGLADPIRFASTANLYTCEFEVPTNDVAATPEILRDRQFRHPLFGIHADNLPGEVSKLLGLGLAYLLPLRKLTRKRFIGHVNNLQTKSGFYASAGIPSKNCRCTYIPWVPHLSPVPVIRTPEDHAAAGNAVAQWDTVSNAWVIVFPDDSRTVVRAPSALPAPELEQEVRRIAQARSIPFNQLQILRMSEMGKPAGLPDEQRAIHQAVGTTSAQS